jgi:beta-xylosidase
MRSNRWRSLAAVIGALALAPLGHAQAPAPAQTTPAASPAPQVALETKPVGRGKNPLFAAADPHLTIANGRWWIYATTPRAAGNPKWQRLYAYSSPDLRNWTQVGPIFSFDKVDWIDDDGAKRHYLWAPALAAANGKYYLYYSVGPQNPTPSRIGVAVGDSPAGPFVDSGAPLITGDGSWEAIDPVVFKDPKSGTTYLFAGGSAGAKLHAFELDASMTKIAREVPVEQPPAFTEGAFIHERGGAYYLTYSSGRWYDASYSVHYSTGPSPLGPWTYRGPILVSDARRKGPGHHSIARNPVTGDWVIAYHRWESSSNGPFSGDRRLAIQALSYNPDGTIAPIKMDDDPPPLSPLPLH